MTPSERAEWLEKRRKCITGTDISAIVGMNPWASPMNVFLDKLCLSEPIKENEAMRWGKDLEPVVAARYSEETGSKLTHGVWIQDGIFGGTPDFLTDDKVIEIKTTSAFSKSWGESGTDQIPDQYLCQVQWYMMLTGRNFADIPVLVGGNDYRVYHVQKSQQFIDKLRSAAVHFWDRHIVAEVAPEMDGSDGCKKFLTEKYPKSTGNMLAAGWEMSDVVSLLISTKEKREKLIEVEKACENKLKLAIGEADGMIGAGFKATWKSTKDGITVDYEGLCKKLGATEDNIKDFSKPKPGYRRFVLTTEGNK